MARLLILGLIVGIVTPVFALPAPNPDQWFDEYQGRVAKDPSVKKGRFSEKLVMIEKMPDKKPPILKKFNLKNFNAIGYIKTPPINSFLYFVKLNTPPTELKIKNPFDKLESGKWIDLVAIATQTDTVINAGSNPWEIYIQNPTSFKMEKAATSGPPPGGVGSNEREVLKWMTKTLGYDSILLDRKGSFFLVAALVPPSALGTQGLAFKNSEKLVKVASNAEGSGVLELKAIGTKAHVYELIISSTKAEDHVLGAKMQSERSAKK